MDSPTTEQPAAEQPAALSDEELQEVAAGAATPATQLDYGASFRVPQRPQGSAGFIGGIASFDSNGNLI